MAFNCGGRPPDPAQMLPGYLLMKKNGEIATMSNKVAIESSHQVAITNMFDSGSCASHNMLTGSASCIYVGSKSADGANYKGVCLSGVGYDEGACSNNIIDVAAKMKIGVKSAYYKQHHEIMEAPALVLVQPAHDLPFQGADHVGHEVQQLNIAGAGREYAPPATLEIGDSAAHVQLQAEATDHDHHRSQHDMELRAALQLQGQSAAPLQLPAGANHCCSTKELAGPELPQPAAGTDHPRPYYDMSIKMRARQRPDHIGGSPDHDHHVESWLGDSSDHIRASLVVTQGEVDHTERGQLQYMKNYTSPERSSMMMMSMEEQDGVYYGGGGHGGAWGDEYSRQYIRQRQMSMMKKRRLTKEQVKSLEVSFERESKLEAERKRELAQELQLQPRQVAVWFQNRRARFKTKQLERDFDLLKHQYDAVRSHKDKLLAQVAKLKLDLVDAHTTHVTAATGSCKGKSLLTPPNDTDDVMDEDKHSLSPEKQKATTEGTRKQKATTSCSRGEQKATSQQHIMREKMHASVLASKSLAKGSFTLDVKPSLQVPHNITDHNYYYHRQQQFPMNTLSPPATNLSLCSPQHLFLHHMQVVMSKMEGDNLKREPHLYNDRHNYFHLINQDIVEDQDGSNSTSWHHDP